MTDAESAPVRTLIIDDEPIARAALRGLVQSVSWLESVGEADSGPAAVDAIDRLRPELVFLDIQMPGFTGIDVLKRTTHKPFVVFTTAYAQHAVTAFEIGAVDYLLKPFGRERFDLAMERVRAALGEPLPPAADRLAEALSQAPISRLFVRASGSVIPVAIESISRFEAWGDYVLAFSERTRHTIHLSLARLETRLDPSRFARIHRAHIVNLSRVAAFRSEGKGRLVAAMKDGTTVAIGRAYAKVIRKLGA